MGVIREASGVSRLLGAAKLQSAPCADKPRYVRQSGMWDSKALSTLSQKSTTVSHFSATVWTGLNVLFCCI